MAKKTAKKSSKKSARKSAKRSTGKRGLIKPKGDARFVRRTTKGRFSESDDVGRSQKGDRRTKAKKAVKSGYGDRGDRKR